MRPLSVLNFIKGSAAKVLPMTVTVCLAVTVLYFMGAFVKQLDTQVDETALYPLKNMSAVMGGKAGIAQEDVNKISSRFEASRFFFAQCMDVMVYNAVGNSSTTVMMIKEKNIESVLALRGAVLVEGRMPKQAMEVILHKKLAANHGLQVGSTVSKGQRGWRIQQEMKVVGLYGGKAIDAMGIAHEDTLQPGVPWASVIVLADEAQLAATNQFLEEHFAGRYNIYTSSMIEKVLAKFKGPMNTLKIFIGTVLVLVMGVFLTNITTIQYAVRKKELELLHAIGYTRKYLIGKAFAEIGAASFAGYLCGIAAAAAICWVINVYAWNEKGLNLPVFSLDIVLAMFLVPLFITLFSMIAPLRMTKFRDIA